MSDTVRNYREAAVQLFTGHVESQMERSPIWVLDNGDSLGLLEDEAHGGLISIEYSIDDWSHLYGQDVDESNPITRDVDHKMEFILPGPPRKNNSQEQAAIPRTVLTLDLDGHLAFTLRGRHRSNIDSLLMRVTVERLQELEFEGEFRPVIAKIG